MVKLSAEEYFDNKEKINKLKLSICPLFALVGTEEEFIRKIKELYNKKFKVLNIYFVMEIEYLNSYSIG